MGGGSHTDLGPALRGFRDAELIISHHPNVSIWKEGKDERASRPFYFLFFR